MTRAEFAAKFSRLFTASVRERALFGGLKRQIALQYCIGGPAATVLHYHCGPLAGLFFHCLTTEKYFWLGEEYEAAVTNAAARAVGSGAEEQREGTEQRRIETIYDIGAHAGFYSLLFARLCPNASVFAFEPDPITLVRLEQNTRQMPNIKVIPRAVSDRTASARFSQSTSTSQISAQGDIEVATVALDECGLPAPDFIKMDIEGHGARAFAGAKRILEGRPRLLVEVHNDEERTAIESLPHYRIRLLEQLPRFPYHLHAEPEAVRLA
jgi:FkbM family methyltransferase